MLVKLRISNEPELLDFFQYTEVGAERCYLSAYLEFLNKYEDLSIPSFLSVAIENTETILVFEFNGVDKRTNTYFYKFVRSAS